MSDISKLHEELMQNPEYRAEYEATREDFALQSGLIMSLKPVNATTIAKCVCQKKIAKHRFWRGSNSQRKRRGRNESRL